MTDLRIGELARQSCVPIATIKHYIREGLIAPTRKTGRTMSWYAPAVVSRIAAIKELQKQFLPLDVIKTSLASVDGAADDHAAADAIAKVLARHVGKRSRSRQELLDGGANALELDILAAMGLAVPTGSDQRYTGDDLALLATLGTARRAGLEASMMPFAMLDKYLAAVRALVELEVEMFRTGIMRAPSRDVPRLSAAATELSERLLVLVRRKLLIPTLQKLQTLTEEDRHEARTNRPANDKPLRVRRTGQRKQQQRRRSPE